MVIAIITISNPRGIFTTPITVFDRDNLDLKTYAIKEVIHDGDNKTYVLATKDGEFISLDALPPYDQFGLYVSEYQPMVVLNFEIDLIYEESEIIIRMFSNSEVHYSSSNWLSNCVQFVLVSFDENTNSLTPINNPKSFVTVKGNTLSKKYEIEIDHSIYPKGTASIWIVMEYNEKAIEVIHSNLQSLNIDFVNLLNDCKLEVMRKE